MRYLIYGKNPETLVWVCIEEHTTMQAALDAVEVLDRDTRGAFACGDWIFRIEESL